MANEFEDIAPGLGQELRDAAQLASPDADNTFAAQLPARPARYAEWPQWVHPALREYYVEAGIPRLYSHQRDCADSAWAGRHTVVATGTSSGKSLGYLLPVLTTLADAPSACALYITPTKALGNDQLAAVTRITAAVPQLRDIYPAPYDGDTPVDARRGIRDAARFVFTNPDMLHFGILAHHERWGRLLRHLRYVVVDECHSYRGVFGAHVALVLRRLLRLARGLGANPVVIAASATSADPADQVQRLIGEKVVAITDDGAPTGTRAVLLWRPPLVEEGPARRSANREAAVLMAAFLALGARTLAFVRSRAGAEAVSLLTQELLSGMGRADFARRVAAYRAGYLAEDRRRLERALDDGSLLGLATTNALELGIDVGTLDAVITAGFPGTVASFWQQAGRAGRRGQGSAVVFIARDEPLDAFLVAHPEALVGRPIEATVFNPANPHVLRSHVWCAALERSLSDAEITAWEAWPVVEKLAEEKLLRRRPRGWFALVPPGVDPHAQVTLRGGGLETVQIVDATDGRILGTVESARAPRTLHPGAVYLHQGESFVVDALDLDERLALVHPEAPDYRTQARSTTSLLITNTVEVCNPAPGLWVSRVDVEVTEQVVGYSRRDLGGHLLDDIPLDLPPQVLATRAVAYTVDTLLFDELGIPAADIPGTLHAAEHAAIGILPLLATCDRWDLGGVSIAEHPQTHQPTVFVYDGYPGGAGFADEGYRRFTRWIAATHAAVRDCPCESGCPSCIQSPKCGNGNNPLSKDGAITLLGAMLRWLGPA